MGLAPPGLSYLRWLVQKGMASQCGAIETVMHVWVSCPKLRTPRHQLQKKVGDALDSISLMLGGTPHNEQGNVTGRSINREVVDAVLDFTDASQRF